MSSKVIRVTAPGGLDRLVVDSDDVPDPGPGEVRVRTHACSLNFHDYAVVSGLIPVTDGRIPMSDGAGVVDAVGPGVSGVAVGDRVMSCFFPAWADGRPDAVSKLLGVPGDHADGFAAEYVNVSAGGLTPLPEGYGFEEAASLPCAALTAWRALIVEAQVQPGDTVLVQGTGGVSVFALQFALAAGCEVIATSSSDAKLERLTEMGAAATINYVDQPEWGDAVLAHTGGRGVDVVVEVGGAGTLPQSIKAVAFDGHIAMIGVLTSVQGVVPTAAVFGKNAHVVGITVGSRQQQLDMVRAIEANDIRPVIHETLPLDRIADAFRLQESGAHFGRICLSV